MPETEIFLLGVVWWNTATKRFHGMECQNRLPYTFSRREFVSLLCPIRWNSVQERGCLPRASRGIRHEKATAACGRVRPPLSRRALPALRRLSCPAGERTKPEKEQSKLTKRNVSFFGNDI